MSSLQPGCRVGRVADLRLEATARRGKPVTGERFEQQRIRASAAPRAVRVLVADGQGLLRAGFRVLLEADRQITVVGEAACGEEAVALARRTRPDVVLIDVRLPGLDSVEAIGRLCAGSGLAILLLVASEGDERMFAALRAGASGVLLKDTEPTELVRAVKLLARGETLLSPSLTHHLIAEFASRPEHADPNPEPFHELTTREREVVALVALGLSNAEIAERLAISPATVKTHVSRAILKLRARDRAKLVALAYETRLVVPGEHVRISVG
jgi:DNA-binding NarL/FixJ family response regulator